MTLSILGLTSWSSSAQAVPEFRGSEVPTFLVAYDHLDSLFDRSLSGTLEIADGHLRFRAINRVVAWDIPLEDVISIKIQEVMNPLRVRVRSIVIESREGTKDVRRRLAPIDEQLQFMPPIVLSALMKDRWKQQLTVFSSRRRN